MRPGILAALIAPLAFSVCGLAQTPKGSPSPKLANPLVTALRFAQANARREALTSEKDRELQATLALALRGKDRGISWRSVRELFGRDDFMKLAGGKEIITLEDMDLMLQQQTPASRSLLFPKIRQHADLLTTQFHLIEERHSARAEDLVGWIAKNYRAGKPLAVTVICTGNSRRSMLGSTLGNIAADYYGLPALKFYSGGTSPSAFNSRTIATLKDIGVEIESTGKEAPRGKSGEPNAVYRVRWGKGQEALEFSKRYSDAPNPQQDFAAILVCSEADAGCPLVHGASIRIAVPYADPKLFDGAPFEGAKYAERRDDIGRFMLNVAMQARRRIAQEETTK